MIRVHLQLTRTCRHKVQAKTSHEKIQADLQRFLEGGGKIKQIPRGVSGVEKEKPKRKGQYKGGSSSGATPQSKYNRNYPTKFKAPVDD